FALHTSVTDTLVYPNFYRAGLNLPVAHRTHLTAFADAFLDPDPILEDTPDPPDEDEIDYTVHPPEVGQNVIVGETGAEVTAVSNPVKQKRVLCSFSSQGYVLLTEGDLKLCRLSDEGDPDDYPFDAVTYGDSLSCLGLPYNDHTYVSAVPSSKGTSGDEDRLCLLAKLALAKDEKQVDQVFGTRKTSGQSGLGLILSSDELVPQNICRPASDVLYCTGPQVMGTPKTPNTSRIPTQTTTSPCSLIATNPANSSTNGRSLVISPSSGAAAIPPLQVHRVSSSLTPHIILRTGLPGLQISTTASRSATSVSDSGGIVRCSCGNARNDCPVIQCDKCRSWQHVECVSSPKRSRLTTPYVCESCGPHPVPGPQAVVLHRQKLPGISTSAGSGIWMSRTTSLSTANSSGRVLVTNALSGPVSSRQVQLCLSSTPSIAPPVRPNPNQTLSTTATGLMTGNPRCFNLITGPTSPVTSAQTTRSSKRKQDLLTLTGTSLADGLECVSKHSPAINGLTELVPVEAPFSVDANGARVVSETVGVSVTGTWDSPVDTKPSNPLHRLLVYDTSETSNYTPEHKDDSNQISPPSSIISSGTLASPSIDAYEETTELRLSERFYHKMESLLSPTYSPSGGTTTNGFSKNQLPPRLPSFKRYQVMSFDFNRKGLIALADIYPGEPVVEYHGVCMLLSEYNEMYDYRKHPYVLFYKSWTQLPLCVDARKFGNEARYIRRSCTPNCEVRHFVSTYDDPLTGPTSRIRLIVFAIRPITRSTELTLHFDFDYTTCRYLVPCACARKACPVARWFRQSNHFDNDYPGADTFTLSQSLSSTRKFPFRGSGLTSRPRGFVTTGLDNYSDILADDCDQGDGNGDLSWITDDQQSMSRLQPHRTFRRGSRGNGQAYPYDKPRKPIKLRGQGRGRRRATSNGALSLNGRSAVVVRSGRGRPPVLDQPLRSNQRHHPGRYKGRRSSKSVKIRSLFSQKENSRRSCTNGLPVVDERSTMSSHSSSMSERSVPHPVRGTDTRQQSNVSSDDRDLAQPLEHASDDDHPTASLKQSPSHVVSSINAYDRNSVASRLKEENTTGVNFTGHGKNSSSDSGGELKSGKPEERSTKSVGERRRRRNDSRKTPSPVHQKEGQLREEDRKKSREEIWMAEVLRRIERMEKKQQHKQRTAPAESDGTPSDKGESRSVEVSSVVPETVETKLPSIGDCPTSSLEPCRIEPETHELDSETAPLAGDLEDNQLKSEQTSLSCQSSVLVSSAVSSLCEDQDKHLIPVVSSDNTSHALRSSLLKPMPDIVLGDPSATGPDESHPTVLPSKGRRRLSQSVVHSGNPLAVAAADVRETREERWLKSQLRRIAELEMSTSLKPSSPKRLSDEAVPLATEVSSQSDSAVTTLKEVYTNDSLLGSLNDDKCDQTTGSAGDPSSESLSIDDLQAHRRYTCPTSSEISHNEVIHAKHSIDRRSSDTSYSRTLKTGNFRAGRKRSSVPVSTEADCELIVYRTREKDPMAKFSRSRSGDLTSTLPNNRILQENTSPILESADPSRVVASSGMVGSTAYCTPRPTKKRWLSQALMEEDNGGLRSGDFAPLARVMDQSDVTFTQFQFPVISPSACPVNPKKRIISQFSESHSNGPDNAVFPQSGCTDCQSKDDSPCSNRSDPGKVPSVTLSESTSSVLDPANAHPTPLPPKKATVKQQADEMRKTRVSLSEYRRRRGLFSNNASNSINNQAKEGEQATELRTARHDLHLPHQLLSPNRLLDEIPKIYQQLHLPEKLSTKSNELLHSSIKSAPKLDTKGLPLIVQSDTAFDELPVDDGINERGPRTPSEPPDDDDLDSSNTVYVRKLRKVDLTAIAEEAEDSVKRSTPHSHARLFPEQDFSDDIRLRSWKKISDEHTNPDFDGADPPEYNNEFQLHGRSSGELTRRRWSERYPPGDDGLLRTELRARPWSPSVHPDRPVPVVSAHCVAPPPPPPPCNSFPSHSKNDVESHRTKRSLPHRRYSGPDTQEASVNLGSLEYFIKRDQAIRHWQESHSLDWDRNQFTTRRRIEHTHLEMERRAIAPRHSLYPSKYGSNPNDSLHRSVPASGRLTDVEETLCRLQDRLRSQLDRTKLALTPHGMAHNDSRSSFAHLMESDVDVASDVSLSGHSRTGRYVVNELSSVLVVGLTANPNDDQSQHSLPAQQLGRRPSAPNVE
ncbi:SET domain protein, partial [Opisthorchis viverrini]